MSLNNQLTRRGHPYLRSLPFGLFVGLFLLILILVFTHSWAMRREIGLAKTASLQRLGVYKTSLLATIDRYQYLPQVLASDPRVVAALRNSSDQKVVPTEPSSISFLLKNINRQAGSDEIFLLNSAGVTNYTSNYDTATSFAGSNYGFRPYFRDAMAGVSDVYFAVGATSGRPGLFLSAPVLSESGQTLGVIVIKINLRILEQSWQVSGDSVWVTDEKGIIFLASTEKWRYFSMQPLSVGTQSELAQTLQYGKRSVEPLQRLVDWQADDWSTFNLKRSGPQVVFASPIESYAWHMHLRMPLAQFRAQLRRKQGLIILFYAGIAIGSLFYRERRRRTHAQNALAQLTAERESHQRAIIQNTDVGLLNLNAQFEPLFLNEQARTLFKLENEKGFNTPADLIQPWDPDKAGVGACRAEGVRSDGSRFPVMYTLNAIRAGEQREFILTVQDVTELTVAQQALQEANRVLEHRVEERTRELEDAQAALAQNQKLAALGRMSAAIAHEINQPITALSNYVASSQVLLARKRFDSVSENFLKIEALLERLSKLSRQLRIFAGKRNSGSASVSLQAPVRYALELLGPRFATEQVECELLLSQNRLDYLVQANAMVLEQIVVNLLTNAIDAVTGQEDSRIEIRLTELPASRQGKLPKRISLSIEDNGHGMSEDQLGHVFEPFFTTKPMGKGLGLGLAISYSLARDIGADLTVSSCIGRGTCFTLILPTTN
jgi:C4-dicarboxylate-specific signal transduction histidine kinase